MGQEPGLAGAGMEAGPMGVGGRVSLEAGATEVNL